MSKSITRINKFFSLYGLYCPISNDLHYVGITTGKLCDRLSSHLRKPTNGKIALWFKELKKQNLAPKIELIKELLTYEELLIAEINEIKKHRDAGIKLLNIADGGDINPMFGKTHSKEAREKISKIHKGRKLTEEQKLKYKGKIKKLWKNEQWANKVREKMSKNMLGNQHAKGLKHSDEVKKKLSEIHKGNRYSLGFKHTEETKKLMSQNNIGKKNPMYNKSLPKEILQKRSEKVKKEGTYKGKNNGNFKFNIEREELYDLYITKNMKIDEISKIYCCYRTTISDNLKKYNIIKPLSNKYNLEIEKIINYIGNGLNQVEIANIYGCSNKIINKFIKKHKNESK